MGIISIEEVEPGMTLAGPMRTRQGRLLLPSGAEVTEKHLKIARIWGITEADVEQSPENSAGNKLITLEDLDPELKKTVNALCSWKFACCDPEQAVVRRLMRLFRSRAAMGLTRNNVRKVVDKFHGPKIHAFPRPQLPPDFTRPDIQAVVSNQAELVSLPDVFYQIIEVIKKPNSSAADIAEVISKDPSISSRLLRLVNSPFYGFMSRIDTLTRAVAVVGTIEISNLTMGISVTSTFKNIPFDFLDMNDFWEHSIAVGVVARILATQNGAPNLERVFVGGLLHDIGRLTLFCNYAQLSKDMLAWHIARPVSLNRLEQKIFAFSHAGLGGGLLKEWKVPEGLCSMVDNHHAFHKSTDSLDVLFVKTADVIAHSLGYGHSGTRRVPPLTDQEWEKTGLSVNILPTVASQAQNQIQDLVSIIIKEHNHAA